MILPSWITAAMPSGGGSGYVGPLDIVPGSVVAYSQRAMAAAWVSNAITIRRDSDDATMSFAPTMSNAVDVAAVAAFLGGANGFVSTWMDQSGNAHNVVQATASQQPSWNASSFNSLPSLSFDWTATQFLGTAGNVTFATGEFYFVFVVNAVNTGNTSALMGENYSTFAGDEAYLTNQIQAASQQLLYDSSDPGNINEAGAIYNNATAPVGLFGAPSIIEFAWQFGSRTMRVNGTEYVATSVFDSGGPLSSFAHRFAVGANDAANGGSPFNGRYAEMAGWQTIPSTGNQTAIRQNIAAYYGITLPVLVDVMTSSGHQVLTSSANPVQVLTGA